MSLWSFQGARELESPLAENTAVTALPPAPKSRRTAPPISQNSTAYWRPTSPKRRDPRTDEVNIYLGEL